VSACSAWMLRAVDDLSRGEDAFVRGKLIGHTDPPSSSLDPDLSVAFGRYTLDWFCILGDPQEPTLPCARSLGLETVYSTCPQTEG
jgi:hypothetical protein